MVASRDRQRSSFGCRICEDVYGEAWWQVDVVQRLCEKLTGAQAQQRPDEAHYPRNPDHLKFLNLVCKANLQQRPAQIFGSVASSTCECTCLVSKKALREKPWHRSFYLQCLEYNPLLRLDNLEETLHTRNHEQRKQGHRGHRVRHRLPVVLHREEEVGDRDPAVAGTKQTITGTNCLLFLAGIDSLTLPLALRCVGMSYLPYCSTRAMQL